MTTEVRRTSPPHPAPERQLTRRPGLPSGRAVLGALLVVVAAVITFVAARDPDDGPRTRYAIVVRTVNPGATISAADVALRPMTLDDAVAAGAYRDIDALVGSVALAPLSPNLLVQSAYVAPRARLDDTEIVASHELSFPVRRDRTPPDLRRGERIGVLATYGSGADASTVLTVRSAIVLSYDTDPDTIGGRETGRLTLALSDPAAVVATAHAAQVAELTIVRSTNADSALPERFAREDDSESDRRR